MGTALPTSTGQAALWDVIVAALMFLFCEAIAIWYYRFNRTNKNSLIKLNLNAFRIGLTYSLFVEAVKLAT
jgi:predicted Co/Zn/Cd cation transporter (cation efflux family)